MTLLETAGLVAAAAIERHFDRVKHYFGQHLGRHDASPANGVDGA